jgi:hypothetical protein
MTLRSRTRALVAAALLLCLSRLPAQTRQTQVDTAGGQFPLYVTAEYLGMAGVKTVVRIRLRAPELSMAAAKRGLTSFSGELQGSFLKGDDIVQSFKYPASWAIGPRSSTRSCAPSSPAPTSSS